MLQKKNEYVKPTVERISIESPGLDDTPCGPGTVPPGICGDVAPTAVDDAVS